MCPWQLQGGFVPGAAQELQESWQGAAVSWEGAAVSLEGEQGGC